MKLTKAILGILTATIAFTACKNVEYKKTKEGFPYTVYESGDTARIVPGNIVRYHQTSKLGDSLLGTTYGLSAKWIGLAKEGEQNPVAKLLLEAHKGDSILIIQAIDSLMKQNPGAAQDSFLLANKGKSLKTYLKVVEVYKDNEAAAADFEKENIASFAKQPGISEQRTKDEADFNTYFKANNIQPQRTPWGAYVQVLNPGTGPKPKMGQFVSVRYTGKDITGKVFDTNNKPGAPELPLQIGGGGTIIGFEDGVKQLANGGKANVYIPSVIGYGPQGSPPAIQPNQNLVFEIEVVSISDKQPPPPTMPMPDTTRN